LEIGGDKTLSSSPLKNFLSARGYLEVNHSTTSQLLKQYQNKKACVSCCNLKNSLGLQRSPGTALNMMHLRQNRPLA